MGKLKDKLKNSKLLDKVKDLDLKNVLDLAGDFLPDKGGLGIVKNIIQKDDKIPAQQKVELLDAYKADIEELKRLEVEQEKVLAADRDSARKRQISFAALRKFDLGFHLVLGAVLVLVGVAVHAVLYTELKNEAISHLLIGELMGMFLSIVVFYFGSSKGSKQKDATIEAIKKKT